MSGSKETHSVTHSITLSETQSGTKVSVRSGTTQEIKSLALNIMDSANPGLITNEEWEEIRILAGYVLERLEKERPAVGQSLPAGETDSIWYFDRKPSPNISPVVEKTSFWKRFISRR